MVDYSVGELDDTENLPVVCRRDRENHVGGSTGVIA
jgi:hypothetical protein